MKSGIGTKVITPKCALILSVSGLLLFGLFALGVYLYFGIMTREVLLISGIGGFFSVVFPWAATDLETRNRSIRAHNRFVYLVVLILIVLVITQWGTEKVSFPVWALIVVITGAAAAYGVMAYYAVVNFVKWLRGN